MSTLAIMHVLSIALWGGVIACEVFIETYMIRSADQRKMATDLHYRIDLFIEAPLIMAVLVTGALLLDQTTWSTLLAIKIAAALVVIGANTVCIATVVQRYLALRGAADEDESSSFALLTRRIQLTAIFIPMGLAVFALGWVLY